MQNITENPNNFEIVLGTPTSQKLIKLLVTWRTLSVQDLIIKSHISKSQVHNTLKNLITQNIVHSPSRGIYSLFDSPFMKLFEEAYHLKIIEIINSEIYGIKHLLKNDKLVLAEKKFSDLVEQYNPILHDSFSSVFSSLSSQFIEKLVEN
ncbi:MAG: hypothetical protein ACTSWY_05075 [Promethearchaeota archaeon]